ncbi:MAG: glutamine--fructose-6-phosphate transaminase (isomerizing) [Thermoproteota archaeon]|nr:MAG: glutamine--fructose-6-phosphate transaminase (isomerizing) [Candidatus Korarchaeota archaeon]
MCGIFGYTGFRRLGPIILEGLKRLEYRGYDSAGVAFISSGLQVMKDAGKIDEISRKFNFSGIDGKLAISHTRWATHGAVTQTNAHPHISCNGRIAVVHNGIIENYIDLKRELISLGHKFRSETDTEVIPHLIEEFYRKTGDPLKAIFMAVSKLDGSFAFLAIFEDHPDRIFAVRYKSPLVIGLGDGENFVASDVPAFLKYTKKVIFLDDMEVAVISRNSVEVFNSLTREKVDKEIYIVPWSVEDAERGGYPHFMMKEIMEQRFTITRVLGQDDRIREASQLIKDAQKVFLVAAGTSYHACLASSYWFAEIAGVNARAVLASEFPSISKLVDDKSLVIAVSQSGETADVLESVRMAKKRGSKILGIVNVVGSSLMRISDAFLTINAGPEICVLATKSYTSQLTILYLLVNDLVGRLENAKEEIKRAETLVAHMLESEALLKDIRRIAKDLSASEHIFLIGRGISYATSLEGALKIKEVSYIHAEGFAGGELKHGTLALIEEGTPCIAIVPEDETKDQTLGNAMEIKARGGYIIGLSNEEHVVFDELIRTPSETSLSPIVMIIPLQLLAYYLALERGCNVDQPRNLAKSVTVL